MTAHGNDVRGQATPAVPSASRTPAPPGAPAAPGTRVPPSGSPGTPAIAHTTLLDRLVQRGSAVPAVVAALIVVVLLGAAWAATYGAGGSSSALPHLFYIPIVLATLPFGGRGGSVTAVVATVLCGPLMPLDTADGEAQPILGWALRGLMFIAVGALAGAALTLRERHYALKLSEEVRTAISRSAATSTPVDLELVAKVHHVIDDHAFHMVYQPIYSLRDGGLLCVEALARFDVDPYRPPNLWFGAAAYVGRGAELEIAAIEAALAGATGLPPHVGVSVNASPSTVDDPRLHDLIRAWGDRPLTIEITEHAVIDDYRLLETALDGLRDLGVKIAVDDAGAGFASLRHIVLLAPDVIKLDISLTQDLTSSPLRRALGGSLIEFALHSDAQLVIEGIEEAADLNIWSLLGAHACQGYLLGRPGPLPVTEVSPVITSLRTVRQQGTFQSSA